MPKGTTDAQVIPFRRDSCAVDPRHACRRGRFEVTTAGFDPNLQLSGGDPWGAPVFTGLVVPTTPTNLFVPASQGRYLFMLARFSPNYRTALVGLRQYASLFATLDSGEILEREIVSPMWRFPDANISWHVRLVPRGFRSTRNPLNADSVQFLDSVSPALLFQLLTPYVPPNAGRPWGKPLRSDLGNIHDLRYPWRDSQVELELHVPIPPNYDVAVYASVAQHDTSIDPPTLSTAQAAAASPEDAFWAAFGANVQYGRVAASLIFEEAGDE